MKVDVQTSNGLVTVKIIGRIDNFTYPILESDIQILLKTGVKNLLFDMGETTHISMSFIRLLRGTQEKLHRSGGKVITRSVPLSMNRKLNHFFVSDEVERDD